MVKSTNKSTLKFIDSFDLLAKLNKSQLDRIEINSSVGGYDETLLYEHCFYLNIHIHTQLSQPFFKFRWTTCNGCEQVDSKEWRENIDLIIFFQRSQQGNYEGE